MPLTPELLSPAGNWDCARAAVANGADAIYFGMPQFNARLRADNFSADDLPSLMTFLHAHGVKGYVAFNTLVFTSELRAAEAQLRLLEESGVDAVIVQDLGLAELVKQVTPRLRLHASTQMTITSPEGLAFAKRLRIDQAVLARELSLRELERFHAADHPELPLEVFVHGALCVAYSGQCLTSESLGRRSANRGECAQACRMPYQIIVDGELRDLGDKRYLLSPQDLAAIDEIPQLIALGIRSFKIEGRLKTPEYVAAVTQAYRKAIDKVVQDSSLPAAVEQAAGLHSHSPQIGEATNSPATQATEHEQTSPSDRYALEMTFSRGLYSGWMHGVNHQELVGARFGKKRGPFVGTVLQTARDAVQLDQFSVPLKPGDGVVFENAADTNAEQGGRLYVVRDHWIEFQHGKLDMAAIPLGTRVFKTDDPALNKSLRQSFEGDIPVRKQWQLDVHASGTIDAPLHLTVTATHLRNGTQVQASISSSQSLQLAQKRPLDETTLRDQLGRLGGTPYQLGSVTLTAAQPVILPLSTLNQLRRELVDQLSKAPHSPVEQAAGLPSPERSEDTPVRPSPIGAAAGLPSPERSADTPVRPSPIGAAALPPLLSNHLESSLSVLCRTPEQIQAALALAIPRLYLDFEDIRRYADTVTEIRSSGSPTEIFLATPRIQKSGESGFFKLIERAEPDGVLIRNLGAISFFEDTPLRLTGDFSLNVANHLTAALLKRETPLEQLTLSYDLNLEQILDLLAASQPAWFEITLHQHMPMFHMEHCAFAAFLSTGTDFTNCGRPCEKHRVALRDRVGIDHPLKADVGCRNTLFNHQAQTGADFYPQLQAAGLRRYRVELLEEDEIQTQEVLSAYQELLAGTRTGQDLWRHLRAQNQLGVTKGTLSQ
jgi:U32 family peptidase